MTHTHVIPLVRFAQVDAHLTESVDMDALRAGGVEALARAMWHVLHPARCVTGEVHPHDDVVWSRAAQLAVRDHAVPVTTLVCATEPTVMAAYLDDWAGTRRSPSGGGKSFGWWEVAALAGTPAW